MRIEAAGYRGRPVFFQQVMPWTRPARMQSAPRTRNWLQQTFGAIVAMGVLFGAVLVARHNLKKGRGDRRGAGRLAAVVLGATFGAWLIGATHVADLNQEIGRFFDGTGDALWAAAMLWVLYIALEPYVRRFWPSTLVSWSRLVAGRVRDPRVGRDILIGLTFGTVVALIERVYLIANAMLGYGVPPTIPRVSDLEGMRQVLAAVGSVAFNAPFNALWFIFGMVLLRLVFRKIWVTAVAGLVLLTLTAGGSLFQVGPVWLGLLTALVSIALILVLVLRFGLLATTTFFFFNFMIAPAALTLDTSRWFFATSLWILAIGAALAIYGFYAARGGEPLLGRKMLD
jgi:hypothetical protein